MTQPNYDHLAQTALIEIERTMDIRAEQTAHRVPLGCFALIAFVLVTLVAGVAL